MAQREQQVRKVEKCRGATGTHFLENTEEQHVRKVKENAGAQQTLTCWRA
jgi:hypothetical protein